MNKKKKKIKNWIREKSKKRLINPTEQTLGNNNAVSLR